MHTLHTIIIFIQKMIDHEKTFCTRALSEEQLPESRRIWHRLAQGAPVQGRSRQPSVRRHGTFSQHVVDDKMS